MGYVSLGRGITIHREDCKNVVALQKSPERFTEVDWEGDNATSYRVELQVDAWDRTRLLEDLSRTFAETGVNIIEAICTTKHPMVKNRFVVEVGDTDQLQASASGGCATSIPSSTPTASPRPASEPLTRSSRPAVSVVVPFRGGQAAARRLLLALSRLEPRQRRVDRR